MRNVTRRSALTSGDTTCGVCGPPRPCPGAAGFGAAGAAGLGACPPGGAYEAAPCAMNDATNASVPTIKADCDDLGIGLQRNRVSGGDDSPSCGSARAAEAEYDAEGRTATAAMGGPFSREDENAFG